MIVGVVLLVAAGVVGLAGLPPTVPIDGVPIAPGAVTGAVAVLPLGSVTVTGPGGVTAGLVGVQITIPVAVAGVGVHVVPGRVTTLPGVTPLHVTVLVVDVTQVGGVGGVISLT